MVGEVLHTLAATMNLWTVPVVALLVGFVLLIAFYIYDAHE